MSPLAFVEYRWIPTYGTASDLRDGATARRITDFGQIRRYVLNRDNQTCFYCSAAAVHVDHVWPRKYGGPDRTDNLVAACAPCNQAKGDQVRYDQMLEGHWELLLQYETRQIHGRAEEIERLLLLTEKHLGKVDGLVELLIDLRNCADRLELMSQRLYLFAPKMPESAS